MRVASFASLSGKELTQEVIEHLRPRLAAFKLPVQVDIRTDELPRTASGKIVKTRLRQEIADNFGTPLGKETTKQ